ncbi:MAG: hypothetical protein M3Z01_03175 [Thermoproteota archaeon]|nr:hypothetical protein [Thermoproteota archaeon]
MGLIILEYWLANLCVITFDIAWDGLTISRTNYGGGSMHSLLRKVNNALLHDYESRYLMIKFLLLYDENKLFVI